MTKNDWYETGEQIKDLVQEAVDSKDFTQLNGALNNVLDQAMAGLETALKEGLGQSGRTGRPGGYAGSQGSSDGYSGGRGSGYAGSQGGSDGYSDGQSGGYAGNPGGYAGHSGGQMGGGQAGTSWSREGFAGGAAQNHGNGGVGQQDFRTSRRSAADRIRRETAGRKVDYHPVRKKIKAPGEISGKVMKWTGYGLAGTFGLAFGITAAVGIGTGFGFGIAIPVWILGIFFGSSLGLGVAGSRKASLAQRFRKYTEILGERTFCLVEELASAVGQNSAFVRKDLKKMIQKGFFPQGHLDQKGTCLITDNATYQQYLTAQESYVTREMQEEKEKKGKEKEKAAGQGQASEESPKGGNLSPECRELLEEGRKYIRHIHECNDRIPDVTMSEKLDRLEQVTARIFLEAERNPEVAGDLKKMMSYYLPTTRKLLDAYCELDNQPVQGQNIAATKKEIEQALDTVNEAFANLLDSLFEDKAWDISSDISVLETMLAQEGLMGSAFEKKGQ